MDVGSGAGRLRGGRRHGGARETVGGSGGGGQTVVVPMQYHAWQMDVRRALINGAKIVVLACGARSGKDRAGNMMGIELMLRKCAARLDAEAEGAQRQIPRVNAWMVAPTDKLWQQNWDEFLAFIPPVLIIEKSKQAGIIRLRGDICIKFKSADRPEMLVSEGLDFLIVTEASRVRDGRVWYESLLPRLSSPGRDGIALLNGTPISGKGHWYSKVQELAFKTQRVWASTHDNLDGCSMRIWRLPSSCNPEMTPAIIADLRTQMTERAFRCEIMAEPPDEDEKPFRDSDINALDVRGDGVMPVKPERRGYLKSIDIARKKDGTVCLVWVPGDDGAGSGGVATPAQVVDGFALVNKRLPYQIDKCVEMEKKYPGEWIVDATANGGQFFIDQLREALGPGVRIHDYNFGYDSKVELCEGLEYGIEKQGAGEAMFVLRRDLLGDRLTDLIKHQLSVFECEITDKHKLDYHGPGGREDDAVMSLGLGWSIMQVRKRRVDTFDLEAFLIQQFS